MIVFIMIMTRGAFAVPAAKNFVLRGRRADYVVDAQTFRPGYTAGLLFSGHALGKDVRSDSVQHSSQGPASLGQQLTKVTNDLNSGSPYAKAAMKVEDEGSRQSPKQDAGPTVASSAETIEDTPPVANLDACLESALNRLKQRRQATRSPGASSELANYLTYQLAQTQNAGGLPCARGVSLLDTVVVTDEVDAIKILAALRARRGDERTRLVQAAHLAFTAGDSPGRTYAWRQIWLRLSVAAVLEPALLPSWPDILKDLGSAKPRIEIKMGKETSDVRIKTNAIDVRAEMIEGLRNIGASSDDI